VHVPQELTVRFTLQLSLAVTLPHSLPSRKQNAASVSGAHVQTLSPPHTWADVHVPHEPTVRLTPQLSVAVTLPQVLPNRAQNSASVSHTHTLLPLQVDGDGHVPHGLTVRLMSQLSKPVTLPQVLPNRAQNSASVSHTHTLLPLQVDGDGHVPHGLTVRLTPQLSSAVTLPHVFPNREQNATSVSLVQPHTFAVPPPPHETPFPEHAPHELTVRLTPQLSMAITPPQFLPSLKQKAMSVSAAQQTLLPHVCGDVHVPHDITVRPIPQLSKAVTLPQFLPSREQKAAFVSEAQAQTLSAPHVCGDAHTPQEPIVRLTPQLSLAVTLPQFLPSREQKAASVSGTQAHTSSPPHVSGNVHVPHEPTLRLAPQLSSAMTLPQFLPNRTQKAVSVSDTQAQTLSPPQFFGNVHIPHEPTVRFTPQLSLAVTLPQFFPSLEQKTVLFSGMQTQTLSPPHVFGETHVPHEPTARLAPQLSSAVTWPQFLPIRKQKAVSVSETQMQTFSSPHVSGNVHVPHEPTVRLTPQLSLAVTLPQFLLNRAQNTVSASGAQAQTLVTPQTSGNVHVPHESTVRLTPQLSVAVTLPQFLLNRAQNTGSVSHTHTLSAPQVWGDLHVPQKPTVRLTPQLSLAETLPQFFPSREQNALSVS
jgi:hypothetical protein